MPNTFRFDDSGKTLHVPAGDEIQVQLEETPTTGYRWQVAGIDDGVLSPQGSSFSPGTAIGAAGMRTFVFRAERPGTATLNLRLQRPWEDEKSSLKNFQVTIIVDK
ncbi:MAG: peptidase inhibitor I42 [Candidatus Angelobacter sp. Gp1-AA117]|nr:MAG: peptidase inhibitor I42 [Candidatus Angelobacter sp. Gp1-AA117]